jgi:2-hydroxy-3-keto-5-methylthiopentenyl-1-phosphate phosphatase
MNEKFKINLGGIATTVERKKIPLNKIILDIKNPRIQYFLDTSLNATITPEEVKFALAESNDQYEKLKEHIEINDGIYEPIWVLPSENNFVVVEGNTRAFIYEELSEKYSSKNNWKVIDAYILPRRIESSSINFIRLEKHLFGPTPWSAYEKARELHRLYEDEDYTYKHLQSLTKLSATEIRNTIQAFKDMEEQYLQKYQGPTQRTKFSYFVEFRKNKELQALVNKNKLSLEQFCDWVGEDKFKRGEDIRKLYLVLKDEQARDELIINNFQAALDQLGQKNPSANSKLFEDIQRVIKGINELQFQELTEIKEGLQPGKINALRMLYNKLGDLLKEAGAIQ